MATRRSHLSLLLIVLAALAGVALLAIPSSPAHRKLSEGLDLQGGTELVLKAKPPKGVQLTSSMMDNAVSIVRQRVDKLGTREPVITKQGTDEIDVELPAIHDPAQAAKIIGSTAQLELYDLTPSLYGPSIDASQNPVPSANLFNLLVRVQTGQKGQGAPSAYYLFKSRGKKLIAGPEQSLKALKNDPLVLALEPVKPKTVTTKTKASKGHPAKTTTHVVPPGKTTPGFPTGYQVLTVPGKVTVITCDSSTAAVCPVNSNTTNPTPPPGVTYYYLFKHGVYPFDSNSPYPQMTGKDLALAGTQADIDPNTGQPIVTIQFKGKGNGLFHQITRNEAQRGQQLGVLQSFAIVLDNQLYSFPTIDYKQYGDGIDPTGGGAQITGLSSQKEASDLALVLQTGALPVPFVTVSRTDVSATLGKDSLRQARDAAIAGLIIVALFLLVLYRFLGVVAVIGLAIYSVLMYGAILLLDVTLTLPGFAGLILTIGVAADANVVIFERIKEEARAGRSVRAAIAQGYAKGFRTIIDANVVTAITALILFAVATAAGQGIRADAPDRHRRLAVHGRRRDARDARPARRLPLGAVAAVHGRDGAGTPEVVADRRRQAPPEVLHHLARRRRPERHRDRRPGTEPRHRLQGRRAGRVQDAAAGVAHPGAQPDGGDRPRRRDRAGPRQGHRLRLVRELPDPPQEARLRAQQDQLTNGLTRSVQRRVARASRTCPRASAGRS